MTIEPMTFVIVCPLALLAGFIDAVAGGGGFVTLPAYLLAGLPPHFAVATNKLSSTMGTAVATWKYARSGFIPWKRALAGAGCALIASAIGAKLAVSINEDVFAGILLAVLPLTAIYVFRSRALDSDKEPLLARKSLIICMVVAACVGLYDGFYGPGTGTFLILLLTGCAHLSLREANGMTKVVNLSSNFAALVTFLLNAKVLISLGLVAGLFNMLGNYIGASSFAKGGSRLVKPVVAVVLVLFFATELIEVLS